MKPSHAISLICLFVFVGCDTQRPERDVITLPEGMPDEAYPQPEDMPRDPPEAEPDVPEGPQTIQDLSVSTLARAQLALYTCRNHAEPFAERLLERLFPPQNQALRYADAVYVCLANVTEGCAQVDACLSREHVEITGEERAECEAPRCDGTVRRGCTSNPAGARHWRDSYDCAATGKACFEGRCVDPSPEVVGECAPGDPPTCIDGWIARCDQGQRVKSYDCGTQFQRCVEDGERASCEGDGDACSFEDVPFHPQGVMACTDDVATHCGFEQTFVFGCADIHPDLTCQALPGGEATCGLATYDDPTPPTCNGATLNARVAGQVMQFDCSAMGFAGCLDCGDPTDLWCPARCARDADDLARGIERI